MTSRGRRSSRSSVLPGRLSVCVPVVMSTVGSTPPPAPARWRDATNGCAPGRCNKPALIILAKGSALLLVVWTAVGLACHGRARRRSGRRRRPRAGPMARGPPHADVELADPLRLDAVRHARQGGPRRSRRRGHDRRLAAVARRRVPRRRRHRRGQRLRRSSSFIVGRDRPPVEKLDPPAPSGSFPSGHTAAAVAFYAGVFVVVCWHTRNRLVRAVFAVVAVAAPITVGVSRAYRGMHHPIDVDRRAPPRRRGARRRAGRHACRRRARSTAPPTTSVPDRVRRLDLTTPDPDPARLALSGGHP